MQTTVRVEVKFFPRSQGGRRKLPPDLLSLGVYRPHFVIERVAQGQPVAAKNIQPTDEYLGVIFVSQDASLERNKPVIAEVELPYPDIDYSRLAPSAFFTIREGASIVGNGRVL